jgi:hypothetical protein
MIEPIYSRVGHILDGDNRFLGQSTFDGWNRTLGSSTDAVLVALGITELDAHSRDVARIVAVCLTSPDARVWPLKLTRLLASYGNPMVGLFGGQLATAGKVMGPGAAIQSGHGLVWISQQIEGSPTDPQIAEVVAAWCARGNGRFGGFGVPFREIDERRTAMLRMVEGTSIVHGHYWKLHKRVVQAMNPVQPNCVISMSAALLDIGVHPDDLGAAFAILMTHIFLAHAREACAIDGSRAYALPPECVDYKGTPYRTISKHSVTP